MANQKMILELAGHEVTVSNPGKVYFPRAGVTKLDMVRYYLVVAPGALGGVANRPMALKRFVNGAESEPFFQKRAPEKRPDWVGTVELRFPSGRTADEVVVTDEAALAWVINLGCIDLNPHPVRAFDLDHPDELRVDLDPVPGVEWPQIRDVAMVARDVLADFGLTGWPKTSGSRGMHIYARILPRWEFGDVRRAAVAVAREIERRAPELATSKWWKEERHGVFVDYNQNAKDRTVASAYSIRPVADVRVSTPLTWAEVPSCDPAEFTIQTVPARFARIGDPWAEMDEAAGSLDGLLELAARDEAAGLPDAPWPPHYEKQSGEAPRVQPSKRRGSSSGGVSPGGGGSGSGRRQSTMPLIEIARAADQGRGHGGPGTLEGEARRGLVPAGARRRAGRRDARAQFALVPDPPQPAARPRGRTPAARTPGSRLRPLEGIPVVAGVKGVFPLVSSVDVHPVQGALDGLAPAGVAVRAAVRRPRRHPALGLVPVGAQFGGVPPAPGGGC